MSEPATISREALEAREIVARWMISRSLTTGHGDTIEDLLSEAGAQIDERLADRAQLLKERDEALAALRPFAGLGSAMLLNTHYVDDDVVKVVERLAAGPGPAVVHVSDLKRAARLLAPAPEKPRG